MCRSYIASRTSSQLRSPAQRGSGQCAGRAARVPSISASGLRCHVCRHAAVKAARCSHHSPAAPGSCLSYRVAPPLEVMCELQRACERSCSGGRVQGQYAYLPGAQYMRLESVGYARVWGTREWATRVRGGGAKVAPHTSACSEQREVATRSPSRRLPCASAASAACTQVASARAHSSRARAWSDRTPGWSRRPAPLAASLEARATHSISNRTAHTRAVGGADVRRMHKAKRAVRLSLPDEIGTQVGGW